MIKAVLAGLSLVTLVAVTKDQSIVTTGAVDPTPRAYPGMLVINEIMAAGDKEINELGIASDWFEIHNPADVDVVLEAGHWSVADKGIASNSWYELPPMTIEANGYVVIWCDGMNMYTSEVHTDFSLAASGEHLAIRFRDAQGEVIVDDVRFGPQSPGISEGYHPGSNDWGQLCNSTPGKKNGSCVEDIETYGLN